jgi:thymidylate synthase (FAD)
MMTRAASEYLNSIIGTQFPILDQGHVRVIDYMGNDAAVVQMARCSYGAGTTTMNEDEGLIRYLMRHRHTSPFEGCELKLHIKMPIFVARQWIRHRMASPNEYSGRYSLMKDEFYLPDLERLGRQSTTNKQGTSDQGYSAEDAALILDNLKGSGKTAFENYAWLVSDEVDLARELARINLPLSTYTEMYWKIDLHNLLHFLSLRMDSHAQYEIRVYADLIGSIVEQWMPMTWKAFEDYRLNGVTFSAIEMKVLKDLLWDFDADDLAALCDRHGVCDRHGALSKRERVEFATKLDRISNLR